VIIELHGLRNVLLRLAALQPTESNINHVDAIRRMALACTLPLAEFLSKLEKYDAAMAPLSARHGLRDARRKAQWALVMDDEVKKIRAMVSGKVISINLLLAMNASETLARMESQSGRHQEELLQKLEDDRAQMNRIWQTVEDTKRDLNAWGETTRREASESQTHLEERLEARLKIINADTTSIAQDLSSLSIGLASAQTSLVTIRSLGSQILNFLQTFPVELRSLLQTLIRTNIHMYTVLLSIHEKIGPSPTQLLQSNIRLEDALGVVHELPFEYFRYWQVR
jgi:hypothetical protein